MHIEGQLAPGFSPAQSTTGPACEKSNKEGKCEKEYATPLKYYGGPVQHTPKLYLIFWGSNWSKTEEGISRHGNLLNTYGGLTTEYGFNLTYQHILSQYSDQTGPITENGVTIAADYIYEGSAAPQGVSHKTIEAEVEYAIEQNKWTRGPESQFVVLQPAGTAYEPAFVKEEEKTESGGKFEVGCGYHREDSHGDVYGFIPDLENKLFVEVAKCQNYDMNEKGEPYWKRILTMVASHEYAEAVTDPDGANPAWINVNGFEIADICDEAPTLVNEALGIWVTRLWGNHEAQEKGVNEGCVIKDPPEPKPPAPTATTAEASNIGSTSATLNGSVNPNGPPDTHYYFQYGETTAYGSDSPAPPGTNAGYGESVVPAGTTITGLQVGTTYHYRIVASSWAGTTDGADHTFTTSAKGTLTAGAYHTCALLAGGSLKCWGENYYGQLGNGTNKNISTTPVAVSVISNATEVAAGGFHTCALLSTKSIDCWGYNKYGELGDGTKQERTTAVAVSGITNAIQVSSGGFHTCAVLSTGKIECWGENAFEQLGDGTSENSLTPVAVSGISTATSVTAGGLGTCATLSGGKVDCWGYGEFGELGNGKTENSSTPVEVKGITNAVAVTAVGDFQACARLSTGAIDCWGDNEDGELGDGKTENSSIPVTVSGITTATGVTAGAFHTCGLLSARSIDCWGENYFGELGNGTTKNSSTPVAVSGISTATSVVAGTSHTCGRLSGGKADCWGENYDGQLGNGTTTNSTTPVAVTGLP